ncbi:MAG: hypothetical protein K8F32_08610 [Rhodocyclaceae bacterium]|nr:hypothetical protein [Rhodocyclaceae bacterium]
MNRKHLLAIADVASSYQRATVAIDVLVDLLDGAGDAEVDAKKLAALLWIIQEKMQDNDGRLAKLIEPCL